MATTMVCDACGEHCDKAREVNGVFNQRVFTDDAPERFVRIRMSVQVSTTKESYATKDDAAKSTMLKGMDLCVGCMHRILAQMTAQAHMDFMDQKLLEI